MFLCLDKVDDVDSDSDVDTEPEVDTPTRKKRHYLEKLKIMMFKKMCQALKACE